MIYLLILGLLIFVGYYEQSNNLNYALTFCLLVGLISVVYTIIVSFFVSIRISADEELCYRDEPKRICFKNAFLLAPNVKTRIVVYNMHLKKVVKKENVTIVGDTFYYELVPTECGDIQIKVDRCTIKGFFGVLRLHKRLKFSYSFRVYPKPTSYSDDDIKKTTIIGEGDSVNKKGIDYQEIYEIRPFESGDDLRYAHPALSAKFNNYMIKIGSETRRNIITYDLPEIKNFKKMCEKLEIISAIFKDMVNNENYQIFVKYKQDYHDVCDVKTLISFYDLIYQEFIK